MRILSLTKYNSPDSIEMVFQSFHPIYALVDTKRNGKMRTLERNFTEKENANFESYQI